MNFHRFAGFLLQILLQAATTWIFSSTLADRVRFDAPTKPRLT